MALLTVEISEQLLVKVRRTGRPVQEIVTEALEAHLNGGTTESKPQPAEPSRSEIIQQLVTAGLIRAPGTWDTPGAKAWRERPEDEKQQLIKEMQTTYFPDSFASNLISENRR
ncbi:MAG: hypothetical protein R3C14_52925 [Caldilineaceae bacterium]